MPKKVLFLDIDGVLNRKGTKERCLGFTGVDRVLSERFVRLMRTLPEWSVVLSSTWRTDPRMYSHLNEAGITWVDTTYYPTDGYYMFGRQPSRGDEIQKWLDQHPEVESYVILDDMDVLAAQSHRHVQTDERHGLSEDKLAELTSLLTGPRPSNDAGSPNGLNSSEELDHCQPPEVKEVSL